MKLLASSILLLASISFPAESEESYRQIILNYVDPNAVPLALAFITDSDKLADWARLAANGDLRSRGGGMALAGTIREATSGRERTSYLISQSDPAATVARTKSQGERVAITLNANQTIEVQSAQADATEHLPLCTAERERKTPCKLSPYIDEIISIVGVHANNNSPRLKDLLATNNLKLDDRSLKKVTINLGRNNNVLHIELSGFVRSSNLDPEPADAVSSYVLALDSEGRFSIKRRTQDAKIDINSLKFSHEE